MTSSQVATSEERTGGAESCASEVLTCCLRVGKPMCATNADEMTDRGLQIDSTAKRQRETVDAWMAWPMP